MQMQSWKKFFCSHLGYLKHHRKDENIFNIQARKWTQLSTVINYFQIMSNGSFLFGAVLMLVLCAEREREDDK